MYMYMHLYPGLISFRVRLWGTISNSVQRSNMNEVSKAWRTIAS